MSEQIESEGPGSLFVITAPSGAGKTTLTRMAIQKDSRLRLSISTTDRPARPYEQNGVHYHFVSTRKFHEMQDSGEFLESAKVYNNWYGTTRYGIESLIQKDCDVILEIDWQGAQQVRHTYRDSIGIFILPPSLHALKLRLQDRRQDSAEVISRRMDSAMHDLQHVNEFSYVIINKDLDEALTELLAIFSASRLRLSKQRKRTVLINSYLIANN